MESRSFIKQAKELVGRIGELDKSDEEAKADIQKDVHAIFSGSFNPHLPSAHTLFLAARDKGIRVKPEVEAQLARFSYDNFNG